MKRRANYDVGTIENKVEVEIASATSAITTLVNSLNTLKSSLNNTINSTKNNKLKKNITSATSNAKAFQKALGLGAIYAGLRKVASITADVAKANINMIETNNLFEVAMGKVVDQYGNLDVKASRYYTKAMDFQNEMNDKLATNKSELMQYQSMYYSMFKGQNIDKDASYTMSESLTKAGYDIASLYNLSVEEAMNKIKSGIAGQVESLRTIGIDVSESSLSKVLNEVGIERSVQQLSYAEKEVARYIAIIEQAGQAQGDFAKTFESPANQIRVFQNQLIELKQVAGAFIMNAFGGIIVWANAIIMAIKEILKSIASLFGYDLSSGGSSNLADSIGVGDLNTGLGGATKKAKELKKQLMGFDEINNIDKPSKSSDSGSGIATGVDDKLLKSLKEWDNKMGSISGKAQEIRDKMLSWLGFERNDDGTWKLKEGLTNFEKIKDVVKTIGVLILGWKVSKTITGLLSNLEILKRNQGFGIAFGVTLSLTGVFLLYKGMKHLLEGNVDIFTILETVLGGAGTTFGIATILKNTMTTIPLGIACKIGFGVTLGLSGIYMEYQSVKKMLEGDISLGTILQGTGSAFLAGLGIWLITGSPIAGLLGTAGILAFNLGIEIGVALREVDWEGIWKNITDACEKAWEAVTNFFTVSVPKWWNDNIAPWFTKEKWQEIGENMKEGLASKWSEFKDWWGNTALVQWWDNNVAPWFTKEKWQETADKAKQGIETKFTEWKDKFKPIEDWWNTKIAPWFTIEKWKTKINDGINGIKTGFNEWKNNFNPVQDWWNNKIKPWFTWEKWRQIGQDAMKGIQNAFSNFHFSIKLPHFTWTSTPASGWISNVLSALNLPTSLPKLNVSWYASGGMPDVGELFVAREAGPELVGKMGNRNAVANNGQIIEGIKQGVYEAVSLALSESGGTTTRLEIRADEGVIVKKATEGIKDFVNRTGELPFPVPV